MLPAPALPYEAADEIRITRRYAAPLARVWDAWTQDDLVSQWWGPRGFSLTTHAKDLRPGGSWTYTMHGPEGTDWPNFTRYHAVEPHARLVYDHGASSADAAPLFRVTATFAERDGDTELDMRMTLASADAATRTRAFIREAGGNTTWDRLAEFLEQQALGADIFVIARSVETDIDTLFDCWTQPDRLARWLPPTGMTMAFQRVDIAPGGEGVYTMGNADVTMYGKVAYTAIERPHRLEYTQCFTDAEGRLARHPMAPVWPAFMHTTVTFAPEGPSRTRVTVRWAPDETATAAEIAVFASARAGMTQGWTGSFEKLDALVRELAAA